MKQIFRIIFATLLLAIMTTAAASAQSSIEKIIEPLKDGDKGYSVVYREKRSPKTRAVIESSLYLDFSDDKLANRVIEAFKKERSNSVDYSAYEDRRSKTYKIKFMDKYGSTAEYAIFKEGSKWTITVKTVCHDPAKTGKKKVTTHPTKKVRVKY